MRTPILWEELECARCPKKVKVRQGDTPSGWGTVETHDCGLTGYTRTDEVCPQCLAARKGEE